MSKKAQEDMEKIKSELEKEYTQILMFGNEKEKDNLNWEYMGCLEKEAFAKALATHIVSIMCEFFDEHTELRNKWWEITRMVAKEVVLQITQMWL